MIQYSTTWAALYNRSIKWYVAPRNLFDNIFIFTRNHLKIKSKLIAFLYVLKIKTNNL